MRSAAVLITLLVAGLFAGIAVADVGLPPVPSPPPVTVPTLPPTPTVPLPLPPAPSPPPAPAPAPAPPSIPSTPSSPDPVHVVTSAVGGLTGGSSSGGSSSGGASSSGGSGGGGSGPAGASGSGPGGSSGSGSGSSAANGGSGSTARISSFHASRTWLAAHGKKSHRRTTLVFRLPRAGRVVFTVLQVSPRCVVVGSFAVKGHAGTNRTTFAGRVHGHQLLPGTYQIEARAPGGATIFRLTFVVVDSGVPTPGELAAARAENVCAVHAALASSFAFGGLSPSGSGSGAGPQTTEIVRNQQPEAAAGGDDHGMHGLGALTPANISKAVSNPLVLATLAAAIALFGLAALPRRAVPDPRFDDLLARHRVEVALAGTAALLAAVTAMLLG
jgi:hypothetical protein